MYQRALQRVECKIRNDVLGHSPDVLVVGAGISGAVFAREVADALNLSVLVIDERDHIGGDCYDYVDEQTGIRAGKYGRRYFHTNSDAVWSYVNRFSEWTTYKPDVKAKIWVNGLLEHCDLPFTKLSDTWSDNYATKRWGLQASSLDIDVNTYISGRGQVYKYQALPASGYTAFIENVLDHPNIKVQLNTNFFKYNKHDTHPYVVFTGRIDSYFSSKGLPKLHYRGLRFEHEVVEPPHGGDGVPFYFQKAAQVNRPELDVDFTRTVEYKQFPNQPPELSQTGPSLIVSEYSVDDSSEFLGYPVPTEENADLYKRFVAFSLEEKNTTFLGRLGCFSCITIDQAIEQARAEVQRLVDNGGLEARPVCFVM